MTTPQAAVKFFDTDGNKLEEGYYPAPAHLGDLVWLANGTRYRVAVEEWPFRVNGSCPDGQTDWEYATVSTIGVPIG
jgi:hypothetical protein